MILTDKHKRLYKLVKAEKHLEDEGVVFNKKTKDKIKVKKDGINKDK